MDKEFRFFTYLLESYAAYKNTTAGAVLTPAGRIVADSGERISTEIAETLKALRTNVDVLSLSATPIPRTLEMAVTGIREMSTLATPPEDRLPVLTYVGAYEDAQITAAVRRELLRGGQVFYVHNRVQDIASVAAKIHELVPEAHVGIAHGKMGEKQLDNIIHDFWHRDIDVLVCTTIVETGLDIANANTLIVENAHHMGLSQLHQLRGRVGRGAEQSYCILVTSQKLTTETRKRIDIMCDTNDGFEIAEADLKLRGPGDLEGTQQSGIAFDLKIADIARDGQLVQLARDEAKKIIDNDPTCSKSEYNLLWNRLKELRKANINWAAIS